MERKCAMCKRIIPEDKRMNAHHLSYRSNITVNLCFVCHCVVHGRLKFHNPYDKYGKDYSAVYMARDIIELYAPVLDEIAEFHMGGFPIEKPKRKKK